MREHDQSQDITIVCPDCSKPFVWTSGEQRYYQQRVLSPPRRCPKCRLERKARINPDPQAVPHE